MKLKVRYFASVREALGEQEIVDVPDGSSLEVLRSHLMDRSARHAEALAYGRALRCAVDQVMVNERTVPADGSEVAWFPPVTGG